MVRLDDVAPNGTASFVTGGMLNGAHQDGRDRPSLLTPGELYDIVIPLGGFPQVTGSISQLPAASSATVPAQTLGWRLFE